MPGEPEVGDSDCAPAGDVVGWSLPAAARAIEAGPWYCNLIVRGG